MEGTTPRASLAAMTASVSLVALVALLGASAATPPTGASPPFSLDAHPGPWLVTALLAAAVLLGAAGVHGAWRSARRGWTPSIRRLLAASALTVGVLVLLPPIGSADPQSYAAYGQMVVVGHDPYVTTPAQLGGPYGNTVEAPWRDTPSIYGPIATAEQSLAAHIAGPHHPGRAVFVLDVVGGLAFLAVGWLLQRLARDRAGRVRAALLWSVNPLLLMTVVAGGHLDVLMAVGVTAALLVLRRGAVAATFAAGALAGAACGVKVTAALAGVALAWSVRRSPKHLVALAVGAAAVLVPCYAWAGPHAFDQLRTASRFVSGATPWRAVTSGLEHLWDDDPARTAIRLAAIALAAGLAVVLARGLPFGAVRRPAVSGPGAASQDGMLSDATAPDSVAAARAALVVVLAWTLAAAYALPWYDTLAWSLLALGTWSAFDALLLAHTSVLALAYLPGRTIPLPPALHDALVAVKSGVAPVTLLATIVGAVMLARRQGRIGVTPSLGAP